MKVVQCFLARALAALALLLGMAPTAMAHEMSMAEMTLRELQPGQFVWAWGVPAKNRPVAQDMQPVWPAGCVGDARTVRCSDKGMVGVLSIDGVGQTYSAAIVHIVWRGGESRVYTLTKNQPQVRLFGKAQDDRGMWEVAQTYVQLGVSHILSGIDHLLFVLGLLLLVGFRKQLITTVTSFTIAHSLTLAASALGAISLRSPPVETVIALSIVLVSAEALRKRDTLTRRWPALVAFTFGLVHGLGFALKEIGLPAQNVNMALLGFNVGVELGQLFVIGCAFVLAWMFQRIPAQTLASSRLMARPLLLYAMGTVSVYWTLDRFSTLFV
jgi:hydrogenase/urease accessory protein HupE